MDLVSFETADEYEWVKQRMGGNVPSLNDSDWIRIKGQWNVKLATGSSSQTRLKAKAQNEIGSHQKKIRPVLGLWNVTRGVDAFSVWCKSSSNKLL